MSEHIQSAPVEPQAAAAETHERTPGVSHEREGFNFWLIVKVGAGLAATGLVIHVLVWWLLGGLEKINSQPTGELSALAVEDAQRPFAQRLDNVPPPHLEGIERESSLLVLRTTKDEEKRFLAAIDIRVAIGKNEKASLFELREGQRVTLVYHMPGGVGGGLGVVTSVMSPPEKADEQKPEAELSDAARRINGEIVKIEPRSIEASRQWAEVQMDRYGWTDRKQQIVHIPLENAIETVLQSAEFRTDANKKKSAGRTRLPTRSSSGRASAGGQR